MKNLFLAALLAVAVSGSAFAIDNSVNAVVLSSFHNKFKNASNVEWTVTRDYSKAVFNAENKKVEAFYKPNGELMGTSKTISIADLPSKTFKAFLDNYGEYTINEVIIFEGVEETNYFISVSKGKKTFILKADEAGQISIYP